MNKYPKLLIAIALLFIATVTRAQNTSTYTPSPTFNRFTDIVEGSIAPLPNNGSGNGFLLGFKDIAEYNFSQHFSGGLGAGIEFTNFLKNVPVFLNLRWNFSQNRIAPFLNFNFGHGYNLVGFNGAPEVFTGLSTGIVLNSSNKLKLEFSVGIEFSQYLYTNYDVDGYDLNNSITNVLYVPFTIGIKF